MFFLEFLEMQLLVYLNQVAITVSLNIALSSSAFHSFNWDGGLLRSDIYFGQESL